MKRWALSVEFRHEAPPAAGEPASPAPAGADALTERMDRLERDVGRHVEQVSNWMRDFRTELAPASPASNGHRPRVRS